VSGPGVFIGAFLLSERVRKLCTKLKCYYWSFVASHTSGFGKYNQLAAKSF